MLERNNGAETVRRFWTYVDAGVSSGLVRCLASLNSLEGHLCLQGGVPRTAITHAG